MELISLDTFSKQSKIKLLQELGYDSDGIYVLDNKGEKVKDRYLEEDVKIDNMIILPGSTIILDNNELSIASYFEEFGDGI